MTSKLEDGLIHVPSAIDSVAVPRTEEGLKLATGGPVIRPPTNYDRAKRRLEETGSLSLDDFNSAADVGAFIDFYNETLRKSRDDYLKNEIIEISKYLAKIETSKSIVLSNKKDDKI